MKSFDRLARCCLVPDVAFALLSWAIIVVTTMSDKEEIVSCVKFSIGSVTSSVIYHRLINSGISIPMSSSELIDVIYVSDQVEVVVMVLDRYHFCRGDLVIALIEHLFIGNEKCFWDWAVLPFIRWFPWQSATSWQHETIEQNIGNRSGGPTKILYSNFEPEPSCTGLSCDPRGWMGHFYKGSFAAEKRVDSAVQLKALPAKYDQLKEADYRESYRGPDKTLREKREQGIIARLFGFASFIGGGLLLTLLGWQYLDNERRFLGASLVGLGLLTGLGGLGWWWYPLWQAPL